MDSGAQIDSVLILSISQLLHEVMLVTKRETPIPIAICLATYFDITTCTFLQFSWIILSYGVFGFDFQKS